MNHTYNITLKKWWKKQSTWATWYTIRYTEIQQSTRQSSNIQLRQMQTFGASIHFQHQLTGIQVTSKQIHVRRVASTRNPRSVLEPLCQFMGNPFASKPVHRKSYSHQSQITSTYLYRLHQLGITEPPWILRHVGFNFTHWKLKPISWCKLRALVA